ncbi:NAD(P)-binding domain-containing protein [Agrococcus sp. DT81.2]|uniref:NAD(P)-binding domain-containing protein n=1 Tax=Agrococcus sp. DT81.2 TaxID=3393414 RepID=UPI003CE4F320
MSRAEAARSIVVVGGGQAALAVGYFLARLRRDAAQGRRASAAEFELLESRPEGGGSWADMWPSLRLFSPSDFSSLPGMRMPQSREQTASAPEVVDYLRSYAECYELPVSYGEEVSQVSLTGDGAFQVDASGGSRRADAVVMATGTWGRPFVPSVTGADGFGGRQLHSREYAGPDEFQGMRVGVVGGGNSGAQIAADLQPSAQVTWVTRRKPRFLPDDVGGRELFAAATQQVEGRGRGVADLGDIVALPPVRAARDRGLRARWDLHSLTHAGARWNDGAVTPLDAVIWCTGFRPDLAPLRSLDLDRTAGAPRTRSDLATASANLPGLYFVGYGDWCGPASATLVGVGRVARATVADIGSSGGGARSNERAVTR